MITNRSSLLIGQFDIGMRSQMNWLEIESSKQCVDAMQYNACCKMFKSVCRFHSM